MQPKKKSLGVILLRVILILAVSLFIAGAIKYASGAEPFRSEGAQQTEIAFPKLSFPPMPKQAKQEQQIFLPLALRSDGQQIKILNNSSMYIEKSEIEILHIVGEIANNSQNPIRNISVTAVLYPANGTTAISTIHASPFSPVLFPGEKTCFNLYLEKPRTYARYEFAKLSYEVGAEPTSTFETRQVTAGWDEDNDWYILRGQVQNVGATPFTEARVIATLYDDSGTVIGCDQTFVSYQSENPFSVGTFSLYFMDKLYDQVDAYRLQVVGQ
ncbi:MAG TPA: hypothetical protein DCG78_01655 [Anaerolineaceae bacterium]|jgi:hypothetical protein|nr:hypothetical protein [Anaerolineaceae bacterium]